MFSTALHAEHQPSGHFVYLPPVETPAMLKKITVTAFSRDDTGFLKGIAILLIVLHNFYRWVLPITGENEFAFNSLALLRSWIFIRSNPLEIIHVFFNFLGHYGVQAFIFISAYGLTRSFREHRPGYGKYILHRLDKLYPSLFLAATVFVIFYFLQEGKLPGRSLLADLGIQLSLSANLVPGKAMAISGPWWFYSFIFQFYLVFPLFYWLNRKTGWIGLAGLTVAGLLLTWFLYAPMTAAELNPYQMFIGHMPELCLGIFVAGREKVSVPWWLFLIALFLFAGGNALEWLWPFANLGVTLLLIVAVQVWIRIRHRMKNLFALLSWIGIVSMYLFACHGFMRSRFIDLANTLGSPVAALGIAVLFVTVAIGVAYLMMQTERSARRWIGAPAGPVVRLSRTGLLLMLTAGLFSLLFIMNFRNQEEKDSKTRDVEAFSGVHSFEQPIPGRGDAYCDTVVDEGSKSLVLSPEHAFSPGFTVDFDSIDLSGIYVLEARAMIWSGSEDARLHLVMEISDKPSDRQVEWQSAFLSPGKFPSRKWFPVEFRYPFPSAYLMPNYRIKVYLWNPGGQSWYADNLKLTLRARR
jgi:peptidoglycan/LPS O-acetylase OafA/YrhL